VMRLVLATKNPDKVREMRDLLDEFAPDIEIIEGLDWPDVEETGTTLEENALIKARTVAGVTGVTALADDTGLEVDALSGRPGVNSARFAGAEATYAENRTALLAILDGVTDRKARFRTVVALVSGTDEIVVDGIVEGVITDAERGQGGFGYDPIFEVDGRTLAEMGEDGKNMISHRARALEALAAHLKEVRP
jgi:XTP/dITP diphosphohydrolase